MTGPENYKEAERLVRAAQDQDLASSAVTIDAAQVHAALALAAATALGLDPVPREYDAWDAVCGVKKS